MSGYLTTDENGEFSGTVTGLTGGNYVISATFEGDNEYNQSTTNRQIIVIDTGIELSVTAPTQIIQTGDTVTITATLTKNGLPFVNEELDYEISSGSTIIDSDSDFTNNAGQISFTYTGAGAGDINIRVSFGASLQESIVVQDCISAYADTDSTKWNTNGATGVTFNSNGLSLVNSNWANVTLNTQLSQGVSIEYKITALGGTDQTKLYYNFGSVGGSIKSNSLLWGSSATSYTMLNAVVRFEIDNNTIKIYLDDVLKITDAWSASTFQMAFSTGNNRSATIKDIIIKAL